MRTKLNNAFWIIGFIALLVLAIGGIYLRFVNLDVTTARLMFTYWKPYALLVGIIFLCLYGMNKTA
jgi:uncharacterized membrane protein YbhN (UPF0104 family)